jgi:hypothetical protein
VIANPYVFSKLLSLQVQAYLERQDAQQEGEIVEADGKDEPENGAAVDEEENHEDDERLQKYAMMTCNMSPSGLVEVDVGASPWQEGRNERLERSLDSVEPRKQLFIA